jgi:hypothetical protein
VSGRTAVRGSVRGDEHLRADPPFFENGPKSKEQIPKKTREPSFYLAWHFDYEFWDFLEYGGRLRGRK